ncbi:hypothetical protein FH972_012661 [Carpinus fangiana]|uniref:Uncharacterized protein n=1 Tax=Carpinus fangiana TaxID=176857 RepID=A0A5N6R604_9ROSI|nr:hypothetical protein FH972_012661 [Carpinus fangiana]
MEGEGGDLRSEIRMWSNFGGSLVSPAPPMVVVRCMDFKEIVTAIKENFKKAVGACDKVFKMLEIGWAQLN